MLDTIVSQPATQIKIVECARASIAQHVMLNVRGWLCRVPRSEVDLQYADEVEFARNLMLDVAVRYHAQTANWDEMESALDDYEQCVIRNYRHEQQLIARFGVGRAQ